MDNNNTYINNLSIEFRFDLLYRCLYYIGYIINLVACMLLFGANLSALDKEEEDLDAAFCQILVWRKIGPVGKLQNIIFWIFDSKQHIKKLLKL